MQREHQGDEVAPGVGVASSLSTDGLPITPYVGPLVTPGKI